MECELPDIQAGFRKGRGTRDQIANIHWIIEKAREFQKNILSCFIDYAKAFDCVDHKKLWKILKGMGIPDHLICLLRNLYAGQEATVRTVHGTAEWFQISAPQFFQLLYEAVVEVMCVTSSQSTEESVLYSSLSHNNHEGQVFQVVHLQDETASITSVLL